MSNFKKLDPHPGILADLMIHLLTSAIDTARIWGYVESAFADSLGSNYNATIEHLAKARPALAVPKSHERARSRCRFIWLRCGG